MKICWDNLNKHNFRQAINGTLRSRLTNNSYYIHDVCLTCGEPFLGGLENSKFCDKRCANLGQNNAMSGNCGEKNPFYGRKHSKTSKENISINHINVEGKNNPNWKGGISAEPYCFVWRDREYKESIKQRDGYKCLNTDCWKSDNVLTVHHIDYNKKSCEPENLITLCRSCNARANFDRDWHKAWYQAIMYRRSGCS